MVRLLLCLWRQRLRKIQGGGLRYVSAFTPCKEMTHTYEHKNKNISTKIARTIQIALADAQSFQMLAHEGLFADSSEALTAKMNGAAYVP